MIQGVQKTLSMTSAKFSRQEVETFLKELLHRISILDVEKQLLILSLVDTMESMMNYTHAKGIENELSLTVDIDDVRLKVSFADTCNVFNGDGLSDGVLIEKKYALGLFLLRTLADEISYGYKRGFENELTIIRFLP